MQRNIQEHGAAHSPRHTENAGQENEQAELIQVPLSQSDTIVRSLTAVALANIAPESSTLKLTYQDVFRISTKHNLFVRKKQIGQLTYVLSACESIPSSGDYMVTLQTKEFDLARTNPNAQESETLKGFIISFVHTILTSDKEASSLSFSGRSESYKPEDVHDAIDVLLRHGASQDTLANLPVEKLNNLLDSQGIHDMNIQKRGNFSRARTRLFTSWIISGINKFNLPYKVTENEDHTIIKRI